MVRASRVMVCLSCVLALLLVAGQARATDNYVTLRVSGIINPVKVRLVKRALERARSEHATLFLVNLDTPGGLVSSMNEIVTLLTNASLPVVTTLRNILGQHELDEILAEREKIGVSLQRIIDEATDAWGVKVSAVEIKDIELPEVMRRAMARQAEAERERRAKIIAAEGERQSAEKLQEAAEILAKTPSALTLRYLQTLVEIGVENNTTVVFPLPIELMSMLNRIATP